MIVADDKQSLQITGNGDVLEPHDGIIGERVLLPSCCPFVALLQRCIVVCTSPSDRLLTVDCHVQLSDLVERLRWQQLAL